MTTKLSKDGYKIIKKDYDSKFIKEIKDELTVKPFNNFNRSQMASDVGRFTVYLESPKKLYLPRFYGMKNLVIQRRIYSKKVTPLTSLSDVI